MIKQIKAQTKAYLFNRYLFQLEKKTEEMNYKIALCNFSNEEQVIKYQGCAKFACKEVFESFFENQFDSLIGAQFYELAFSQKQINFTWNCTSKKQQKQKKLKIKCRVILQEQKLTLLQSVIFMNRILKTKLQVTTKELKDKEKKQHEDDWDEFFVFPAFPVIKEEEEQSQQSKEEQEQEDPQLDTQHPVEIHQENNFEVKLENVECKKQQQLPNLEDLVLEDQKKPQKIPVDSKRKKITKRKKYRLSIKRKNYNNQIIKYLNLLDKAAQEKEQPIEIPQFFGSIEFQDKQLLKFESGSFYIGQTQNGQPCGAGLYRLTDGSMFKGFWKDWKLCGHGMGIDKFGNKLLGYYEDDKRIGFGIDYYANGQRYEGQFFQNEKSGFGIYYFEDGGYYMGEWELDNAHGKGIQKFSNGSEFQGTWVQDQKHGEGIFTYSDGRKKIQVWEKGVLISSKLVEDKQ